MVPHLNDYGSGDYMVLFKHVRSFGLMDQIIFLHSKSYGLATEILQSLDCQLQKKRKKKGKSTLFSDPLNSSR